MNNKNPSSPKAPLAASAACAQLSYCLDPGSSMTVRGRWKRWLAAILLVTVVCGIAPTSLRIYGRWNVIALQSRCLELQLPPGQVALGDRSLFPATIEWSRCLSFGGTHYACWSPAEWNRFTARNDAKILPTTALMLFIHRRTNRQGESFLVTVEVSPPLGPREGFTIVGQTFRLATLQRSACLAHSQRLDLNSSEHDRVVLYGGQPDPKYAERFSIAGILNDRRILIEGSILEDGKVLLTSP
jgi:hypothetical protein